MDIIGPTRKSGSVTDNRSCSNSSAKQVSTCLYQLSQWDRILLVFTMLSAENNGCFFSLEDFLLTIFCRTRRWRSSRLLVNSYQWSMRYKIWMVYNSIWCDQYFQCSSMWCRFLDCSLRRSGESMVQKLKTTSSACQYTTAMSTRRWALSFLKNCFDEKEPLADGAAAFIWLSGLANRCTVHRRYPESLSSPPTESWTKGISCKWKH